MLRQGTAFVDFDLPAHDGTTVRQADVHGRPHLIYFYPKANTPG